MGGHNSVVAGELPFSIKHLFYCDFKLVDNNENYESVSSCKRLCNHLKVSELYLSCHENVDDHAVASNGNEAEKTDGETQEAMPQWVHGRELIPGNIRLMIILLW